MLNAIARRHPHVAHFAGWLAAGLVYLLAVLPFYGGTIPKLAGFKAIWSVVAWVIAEGLLRLFRGRDLTGGDWSRAATWVLIASPLVAGGWVAIMAGISIAIQGNVLLFFTPSFFPFVLMNHVFIVAAWSGGYLALGFWRRAQADQRRSLAARAEARDAQIELLRQQLSPHFLFNALASLRALITEDPDAARDMVTKLSTFLRSTLSSGDGVWTSVEDELAVLRAYLDIERVRFGDRLEVHVFRDAAVCARRIPTLLLLSLVENAVKHGREVDGRLEISIHAREDADGKLALRVVNSGVLRPARASANGYGLRNVRERLATAYPGRASFGLEEVDGTVRASISIETGADRLDAPATSDGA